MPRESSTTLLQTALNLARRHRWVSDWLFTTPSTPYHRTIILPPPSFTAGLSWRLHRTISPYLLDARPITTHFDCILIPVASVADIIVGYTLGVAAGPPDTPEALHDEMFHIVLGLPFAGRFVYDVRRGEMLHVVQQGVRQAVGMSYMGLRRGGRLDHCSFVMPCTEYSFDNLPCRPLVMAYSAEFKLDERGVVGVQGVDEQSLTVTDSLERDVEGAASNMPWNVDGDGCGMAFRALQLDISSGAFSYQELVRKLAVFGRYMCGRFYVPTVRMDVRQDAGDCSLYTGCGEESIVQLGGEEGVRMRRLFAERFYGDVLGVAVDQRLVAWEGSDEGDGGSGSGEQVVELGIENVAGGVPRESDYGALEGFDDDPLRVQGASDEGGRGVRLHVETPIAPAGSSGVMPERAGGAMGETGAERSARLAHARKQRNRMTAARCNERNREKVEAMQREIGENLERVRVLEGRWSDLVTENEVLRQMVGLMGFGE